MGLFSKLKDYNIELEEILDKKYFSSNIKNLLLSLVYKLEVSYPDYKVVKRCVRSQEDFLNEIIETIRLYCDNMKCVEPDSDQAKLLVKNNVKALTNEKERSILVYPTEQALLYAISDVSPKYFYISDDYSNKVAIQNSLVNGYIQNNMEILNDFSGWSWDKSFDKTYNYLDNLIYQNFLIIFGEKFLYEWRTYGSTRRDFIDEGKTFVKNYSSTDKFFKLLNKACYLGLNEKDRAIVDNQLKENRKQLSRMNDKEKYFASLNELKGKYLKKVEKIDLTLSDSKLLEKNFNKTNEKLEEKKKIKSLRKYVQMLTDEKLKIGHEIDRIDYYLKPSNYLHEKRLLVESLEFYGTKDKLSKVIIEFQKEFLKIVEKRLDRMKTRDEIIDVLFELRYYRKLKIDFDTEICEIDELEDYIDKILKKTITKLCKLGAIKIISMDINLNFEIIKYALDTRIMNLEQIKFEFEKDDQGLIIRIFDKDVYEKQGRKKLDIDKNKLEVRMNRKVKLFN